MNDSITLYAETGEADDVRPLAVPTEATAKDVIESARWAGLTRADEDVVVYVEDEAEPLDDDAVVPLGGEPCRVHIGPHALIDVTVHYNGRQAGQPFSPATTVRTVRRWAAQQFLISETECERSVLQFCDTTVQPQERRHLGALDRNRDRNLCFDFIPKRRNQGTSF